MTGVKKVLNEGTITQLWELMNKTQNNGDKPKVAGTINPILQLERHQIQELFADPVLLTNIRLMSSQISKLVGVMNTDLKEGLKWTRNFEREIKKEFDGLAYLYLKQQCLSAEALYYYKKNNFQSAQALTLECLVMNEFLIREGVSSLIFRAAEQLKNTGKILFKAKDFLNSCKLKRSLLFYLFRGNDVDTFGSIFRDKHLWRKHSNERDLFALSYLVELIYEMRYGLNDFGSRHCYFVSVFQGVGMLNKNLYKNLICAWLNANQNLFSGNYDRCIQHSLDFLSAEIPQDLEFIRFTLIDDINFILKEVKNSNIEDLRSRWSNYYKKSSQNLSYAKLSQTE